MSDGESGDANDERADHRSPPARSELPTTIETDDTISADSMVPPSEPAPAPVTPASGDVTVPAADRDDAAATAMATWLPEVTSPSLELPIRDPDRYLRGDEIARGGVGRIVSAVDRELDRRIAIKELLRESPTLARRFEREVRLTARLHHPAIIGVIEAGRWPDGAPFYVMKHVQGRPLDRIIEDAPTLAERLALLPHVISVAEAVAYAHDQRVIHRDLKPANVLCGAFGETVVIDWGLAKHLEEADEYHAPAAARPEPTGEEAARRASASSDLTTLGQAIGTPSYMPPEQARGETVDARSDVYALGAMLYHLLTGRMPYASAASAAEVLNAVLSGPPPAIEQLVSGAPPDLIAVVGKAMARDPDSRYATATELAADLERFQTGQLVGAHHYSSWQRIARWASRHRGAVTVAAIAAIALAAVGGFSVQRIRDQRDVARTQRQLARQNRTEVEDLLDFMLGDLEHSLEPIGKLPLLAMVAHKADAYYRTRPIDWSVPEDAWKRAMALSNLGDVFVGQGDLPAALDAHLASLIIRERGAATQLGNPDWQHALAGSEIQVGDVLLAQGNLSRAIYAYRASLAIAERQAERQGDDPDAQRSLYAAHSRISKVLREQGDLPAALAARRASLRIGERLAAADPNDPERQRNLIVDQIALGDLLRDQGDLPGALAAFRAGCQIAERLIAADPDRVRARFQLSLGRTRIGDVLCQQGDLPGALDAYQAGLTLDQELVAFDPSNTEWQRNFAIAQLRTADVLLDQGDTEPALIGYRKALALSERLAARDPTNGGWQRDVSIAKDRIAAVLFDLDHLDGALAAFRDSLTIRERLAADHPTSTEAQRDLTVSQFNIGDVLREQHDLAGALAAYRKAQASAERLSATDPSNATWRRDVYYGREQVGDVLRDQGDLDGALASYRDGLAIIEPLAATQPSNAEWQHDLSYAHRQIGTVLLDRRDPSGALTEFRASRTILRRLAGDDPTNVRWHRDLSAELGHIGDALRARGDSERACQHYREGFTMLDQMMAAHRDDPDPDDAKARKALRRHLARCPSAK